MTVKFVTYATYGDMTSDSQPNGTYAQLVSDIVANVYQNYKRVSGAWTTSTDVLYGASVPYLFGVAAITAPTMPILSSPIDTGEVHLIAHGFCLADGVKDEAPVINAIGAVLEARGGGKIIFDSPVVTEATPIPFYNLQTSPILLRNNVTFEGVGMPLIRNTAVNSGDTASMCACFMGNGIAQGNYYEMAMATSAALLDPISANAQFVVCTTHSEAEYFVEGSVYLIFTYGSGNGTGAWGPTDDWLPFFSRQYRVIANGDRTTGKVLLDFPIPVDVSGAVMCDGTGGVTGTIPSTLGDRAVVRNLHLHAEDTSGGKPFNGGNYEGLYENIWCDGSRNLVVVNGMARSTLRNLYGTFKQTAFEFATGSHDVLVDGVNAAYVMGSGHGTNVVWFHENAANITLQNFFIDSSNFYSLDHVVDDVTDGKTHFFNAGGGSGFTLRAGRVRHKGIGFGVGSRDDVATDDVLVDGVDFELNSQAYNFQVASSGALTPTRIRQRNLRYSGDDPSSYSIQLADDCTGEMTHVDFGSELVNIGTVKSFTGPITGCGIGGFDAATASIYALNVRGNSRNGGDGFYTARQLLLDLAVTNLGPVVGITGTASPGSPTITLTGTSTTADIAPGDYVTKTAGTPALGVGTWVVSVDSPTQVTLSANVTGTGSSVTLTFNRNTAVYALPAGQNLVAGDQIIMDFACDTGSVTGTGMTKNVAFADDTGTILSTTVAATDNGFIIGRCVATIDSATSIFIAASITYPVGTGTATVTGRVHRTALDLSTTLRNFFVRGGVGATGPTLTFYSVEMRAKLYGE